MSKARQCTLIVARDPRLESIDGFRTLWCGNGRLEFRSAVGTSAIPCSPGSVPTPRDLADAASNRHTLDIGLPTSSELQLVVEVRSGTKFDITLVEVANGRALRWPLRAQPRLTINGGVGAPVRPEVIAATPSIGRDSVVLWVTGLGFSNAARVGFSELGATRNMPFTLYGDTAIRVACPLVRANRGRTLVVVDSDGVGSSIDADVRSLLPRTGAARILAILREDAPGNVLSDIPGVSVSRSLDPLRSSFDRRDPSPFEDLSKTFVAQVAEGHDPLVVLAAIRSNPHVVSADALEGGHELFAEANDPLWQEQWGFHDVVGWHCDSTMYVEPNSSINLPQAWDFAPFPPPAYVSIIDTGVRASHDDVELAPAGWNALFGDFGPDSSEYTPARDGYGHGTAVASIAAAVTNNGVGLAGAGRLALPASVRTDMSYEANLLAIDHVIQPGRPTVINMSWGSDETDPWFNETVKRELLRRCKNAFLSGRLLVGAAGNTHNEVRTYPAGFDEYVLAVGATLWNNTYWTSHNVACLPPMPGCAESDSLRGSKYGAWLDLTAPGVGITAAYAYGALEGEEGCCDRYWNLDLGFEPGGAELCDMTRPHNPYTMAFWGTSAAAPLVAGTAAWLTKIQPTLTGEDLAQVLQRTATDMGSPGRDVYFGHGRINAAAAAAMVSNPNWIEHGVLSGTSSPPLTVQADSIVGTIAISNAGNQGIPDAMYACVRYHLVGLRAFAGDFVQPPALWVRRADSRGMPAVTAWDEDQQPSWASVLTFGEDLGWFETFVYRLTGFGNRFFPCAPEEATIAYTAIAPSGTLGVTGDAAPIALSVRTRLSPARARAAFDARGLVPGPLRVEVFDITGRRMSVLFEGDFVGGRSTYEWDGRSQGGVSCGAGMYICRVEQPGRRSACRFAFLR